MLSPEIIEIAHQIGQFYLEKAEKDYKLACENIKELGITKIETYYHNKTNNAENLEDMQQVVRITLSRPGLLIGRLGTNADALSKFLNKPISIVEDQDELFYHLMPVDRKDDY